MVSLVTGSVGDEFSFFAVSVGEFSMVGKEKGKERETVCARDESGWGVATIEKYLVVSCLWGADVGDGSDVGGGWGWWSGEWKCVGYDECFLQMTGERFRR